MVFFDNQPPTPPFFHQSPGSGKRHCDPWGDPKTAVAPLPRAPLHHQPPTLNQQPTTRSRFTSRQSSGNPTFGREAIRGESSRLQTQAPQHPPTN
ncbi:MAG: hypothetical protein ACHBN1_22245 [Heteroscytonema crispum UTEX LB 1556]